MRTSSVALPVAVPLEEAPTAWLDVARAVAVLAMVFAHVTDELLAPEWREGWLAEAYALTRGYAGPVFLLVAGWSFATASLPKLLEPPTRTRQLTRRLKRAGLLLLVGYAVTLPWWASGFPFAAEQRVWLPFWAIGPLQLSALCLLLATLSTLLVRNLRVLGSLCLLGGAASLFVLPGFELDAGTWPLPLRGVFEPLGAAGGHPLLPWGGYYFFALGLALLLGDTSRQVRMLAFAAVAFAALPFGDHGRRLTGAFLLLVAAELLGPSARGPTLQWLSRHSLAVYFGHLVMLWGAPFFVGLVHRIGHSLDWAACALLSALCIGVMGALPRAKDRLERAVRVSFGSRSPRQQLR